MYIETQALYKDPFKPVSVIVTTVAQRDLYREQEKSRRLCGPFSSLHPLLCGATQDGWVMVERSERMWPTGEGNGPGEFRGQRSVVGYSPWGHKEWDMTEQLHFHFHPIVMLPPRDNFSPSFRPSLALRAYVLA